MAILNKFHVTVIRHNDHTDSVIIVQLGPGLKLKPKLCTKDSLSIQLTHSFNGPHFNQYSELQNLNNPSTTIYSKKKGHATG